MENASAKKIPNPREEPAAGGEKGLETVLAESLRKDGEELLQYAFLLNRKGKNLIALADAMLRDLKK